MKTIWITQAVISVMLLWALNPDNPYSYYVLLRWACCGIFAYLTFCAAMQEKKGWLWILGITAIVYNPIIPIHLTRDIWQIINIVTIGIAVTSIFVLKFKGDKQTPLNNVQKEKKDKPSNVVPPRRRKWTMSFSDWTIGSLMVFGWILGGFYIIYFVIECIIRILK